MIDRDGTPARGRGGASPCTLATGGRRRSAGFTLIEIMIAVVIVAILTAVALPQYSSYIMKSRRADAKTALLDLAARQERFFALNNAYTNDAGRLGYGANATFPVNVRTGSSTFYTLAVPTVTAGTATALPTYAATATPAGVQQRDTTCYTFRLDSGGARSNLAADAAVITGTGCW